MKGHRKTEGDVIVHRTSWSKLALWAILVAAIIATSGALASAAAIEFWHPTVNPEAEAIVDHAIAEWNAQNPDAPVTQSVIRPAEEMRVKFLSSMAAGIAPDIVYMSGQFVPELADMGAVIPLQELFSQDFLAQYTTAALDQVTYRGDLYGVPLEGATWGFYYRKDLFAEAGLDPNRPPTTWDELVEYGKALTKDTDGDGRIDQWGLGFPAAKWEPYEYWFPFIWQAGGDLTRFNEETGIWEFTLDETEGREGFKFYADLIHTYGITPKTITGLDWSGVTDGFTSGDFAMMFNGLWAVPSVNERLPFEDGAWATAANPAGPGGPVALGQVLTLGISRQSADPQETARFLQFLLEQERHNQYAASVGTMSWRHDYMETEYGGQPFSRPLIANMSLAGSLPASDYWIIFRDKTLNPIVQEIVLGTITVDDALDVMRDEWNALHQ